VDPISGSAIPSPAQVIAPFGHRLSNQANAQLSYQYSANAMIGGGGSTGMLAYSNQANTSGLADSHSYGGSAFFNRRLSGTQYTGSTYNFMKDADTRQGTQSETQVHTINMFYSIYLMQKLTLSVSGGPQHFAVTFSPFPTFASWTTSVTTAGSWQSDRTSLSASYSRSVVGGGGLLGAFHTNSINTSAHLKLARTWSVEMAGGYQVRKNVSQFSLFSQPGGHTASGTVSVGHPLSERVTATFRYQRMHQIFNGIAAISSNPDSDRESISISYQFRRPLGR